MKTFNGSRLAWGLGVAVILAGFARGVAASDEIIDPDSETVISTGYYGVVDRAPEKLVDNSGLDHELHHGDAIPEHWPAHGTNVLTMYGTSVEVYPTMVFTLPELCDLRAIHYWNYNAPVSGGGGGNVSGQHHSSGTLGGIRGVDLLISLTGSAGPFVTVGSYELAAAPGDPSYTGETLPLGQTVRARYVKFVVTSGWGEKGAGFSELRFIGQPTPELKVAASAGNLVVSWKAPATGYRLESSGSSGLGNVWETVAQAPHLELDRLSVEIPAIEGHQVFRLTQLP